MDRTKQHQMSFRQLIEQLRTWATTPAADGETERLDISLFKAGNQVTQVDFQPKATRKGVMIID